MNILIVCFSQTGNTWKAAEAIRSGILETGNGCDITALAGLDVNLLGAYDLIGLGCPVFYYQPPFNITDFIASLPSQQRKQWFIFCSHGSVMGNTLHAMSGQLQEKGAKVIAAHHTYADATVPFFPYPTLTTGHPDEKDLDEAGEFGRNLSQCSACVSKGNEKGIISLPDVTEEWALSDASLLKRDFLKKAMPRLSIDPDRCNECGLCERSCPVKGIEISSKPPRIQEPCIFCWYCAKTCPTSAIKADWSGAVAMAPGNYAKYVKALDAAVRRGEFRWHVDPGSIDFDDPFYLQKIRRLRQVI